MSTFSRFRRTGDQDERFMAAALEAAKLGRGAVEPNPIVGAILTRGGVEIARGWHRRFGGPHAEIEAINAARSAGQDLRGATLYVTLEPCCHHGKTPPCTQAIIQAKIARVVVAMIDPDRKVSSQGIAALRRAGLEVTVGHCQAEARKLLAAYCKLRRTGRPWVICKWAQTADGFLALPRECGRWISGIAARQYVHELRALCDGVLVGIGTVLADDPLLTSRDIDDAQGRPHPPAHTGKQPTRIVLDGELRTPPACQLAATAGAWPVIVATRQGAALESPDRARQLRQAGVEVLELPSTPEGLVDLEALLGELGRREWTNLLVEGGARVLASFIHAGLADELLAFVSPTKAPAGAEGLPRFDVAELDEKLTAGKPQTLTFGLDRLLRYLPGEKEPVTE